MGISRDKWHKRRKTGGKRSPIRMKRRFELGRQPANTKLGERRVHQIRAHGGFIKFRALKLDHGNYAWPGEAVTRKCRIIGVVYNPTNGEFVRTNTLVKGSIVQIDATPFKNWYQKHYGVVVGKPVDFVKEKKFKKPVKGTGKKAATKTKTAAVAKPKTTTKEAAKPTKTTKTKTDAKTTPKPKTKTDAKPTKPTTTKTKTDAKTVKPTTTTTTTTKEVKPTKVTKPVKEGAKPKRVYKSDKHVPSGAMIKKWRLRNATRVLESAISDQFDKGRLYAKLSTSPGQTGTADGYVLEGEELAFYIKKNAFEEKEINSTRYVINQ